MTLERSLLAPPHIIKFFCDISPVQTRRLDSAKRSRLFISPPREVRFVRRSHPGDLMTCPADSGLVHARSSVALFAEFCFLAMVNLGSTWSHPKTFEWVQLLSR